MLCNIPILKNAYYVKHVIKRGLPFATRIASNYYKAHVLNQRVARNLDIAVDYRCNIKCEHCFAMPLLDNSREKLTPADYGRVLDQAKKAGIYSFTFTGGEPLLDQQLEDRIAVFNKPWSLVAVQSNGILMTAERLKSLKQAGLSAYFVSIDFDAQEQHDTFRHHDGASQKAWEGLIRASEAGLAVGVNTTVTKESIYSEDFLRLLKRCEEHGFPLIICLATPVGNWKNQHELLWSKEEREYFYNMQRTHSLLRCEFDSNYKHYGCPAMKEKIYLTCYGDVIPCPFIHISFGNIMRDELKDIIAKCLSYPVFSTYHDHCLAAENSGFISKVIDPIQEMKRPVHYRDVQSLDGEY
ncbi:MAG: radical SAM/SPASM domain-containing protein [Acidobacteriota bacterium]